MDMQPEIVNETERHLEDIVSWAGHWLEVYECIGEGSDGFEYLYTRTVLYENQFRIVGEPKNLVRIQKESKS